MTRILGERPYCIQIERLAVKDVVREPLFQQFHKILSRAATDEPRFHAPFQHHVLEVLDKCQRDPARAGLEREAVAHNPCLAQEARHELGDAQPVGRTSDLSRAGYDPCGIADRINLYDEVNVVTLDLRGNARERNQVVSHNNDLIGVDGIGQCKS